MDRLELSVTILLVSLLGQGRCYSSFDSLKVFYVKPIGLTTECPSGDSPCHTLQYYVDKSAFTNNSRFLFLEGEHHLDRLVMVRNVANLSLVGVSSGVRILCTSEPSGFNVTEFKGLDVTNLAISNCTGIYLTRGSEVSFDGMTISSSSEHQYHIVAEDVLGTFFVTNSTFIAPQGDSIRLENTLCTSPSNFKFSNNKLSTEPGGTLLAIASFSCSKMEISITDSSFESASEVASSGIASSGVGLNVHFQALSNNSVVVSNCKFTGAEINISTSINSAPCGQACIKFTGVTVSSVVYFSISLAFTAQVVLIQDSVFSGYSTHNSILFYFGNQPSSDQIDSVSVQATLNNVTFTNSNVELTNILVTLFNAGMLFVNCNFENNTKSAIQSISSKVVFQGNNTFRNNSALVGGAIQLLASFFGPSYMYLLPSTSVLFERNHAGYVGGAIYIDRKAQDPCFLQFDNLVTYDTKLTFVNNTANFSGSSLYGDVTNCYYYLSYFGSNTEANPSAISSDPHDVCLCEHDKRQPNCDNRAFSTHAFPGQEFPVHLAVVGNTSSNGVVPGAIRAYLDSPLSTLGKFQNSQAGDRPYCKNFNYSISSTEKTVSLRLTIEQYFFRAITGDPNLSPAPLIITVNMMDCPLGFFLSPATGTCVCDSVLYNGKVDCFINNQSFLRPANSWIGFTEESSASPGVVFHPNCPIRYCLPRAVSITSNTSDSQCESHRTGLLCGECADGYSLTLGNGQCTECSNTYLLLILPLAVAGLLLVAILFALNLTVTEGSISGLIFYANVMGMNYNVLISGEKSSLYTFLAWLNLDLGISTCLFNGLDGYAETWLQFIFPIYLWVIILVIIKFYSKFPTLARRVGGQNAVKVLATLLLLSYTKLQRTVVTIKFATCGCMMPIWSSLRASTFTSA